MIIVPDEGWEVIEAADRYLEHPHAAQHSGSNVVHHFGHDN